MLKYIITPLLLCCLALPAAGDEIRLQENHPDRYVVVKGDTLWAISGRFLKDPWLWPKVWRMNRQQIKNPHLIYPGDVVVLDTSSGQPELRVLRETVTLQPGIRVEPLEKEPVPTIAPSTIAPFLSQPLIVEPDTLKDSPTIVAGPQNRVVFGAGNKIYVSKVTEDQGNYWNIYRPGKILVDPETQEHLGLEAVYLGDLRVTKYGEPATAEIVRSKEEIFSDDRLVQAPEKLITSYVPHAPETEIDGRIMTIYGGVAEAGNNTIVAINRGKREGLEEGHVLSINRAGTYVSKKPREKKDSQKFTLPELKFRQPDGNANRSKTEKEVTPYKKPDIKEEQANDSSLVKLPDERIGLLMIFRTFERVSYGLIMQANEPIHLLDTVSTPQ